MKLKFALVFFIIYLVIGVNLPDGVLARLGIDPTYMIGALAAIVITGLIAHQRLALIVLIVIMCIGANLSVDLATSYGINRDLLAAGLIALVLTPFVIRWLE